MSVDNLFTSDDTVFCLIYPQQPCKVKFPLTPLVMFKYSF